MTALTALTERMVLATLRNDLPFAILTPVGIFLFFNLSLGKVIDTGAMSYPQYILPVIIVQVIFLGGLTTVDRAAGDALSDFGVRLRTLPIPVVVPLAARMLYCLFRGTLGSACRDRHRVSVRLPDGRRVCLRGCFHRSCPHVYAGGIARRRCSRVSFRAPGGAA